MWYEDHENLVMLTSYLADNGANGAAVAHAVEKPWNYEDEFRAAENAQLAADNCLKIEAEA